MSWVSTPAEVEALSRVLFPRWWAWFDVHGDLSLSDDAPQQKWRLEAAERAIAHIQSATPSQGLDAATVERCAQVVAELRNPESIVAACDRDGDERPAIYNDACDDAIIALRALATDPHQHGAGNGEKHGG